MSWHAPQFVGAPSPELLVPTNLALSACNFIAALEVLSIIVVLEFKTRKARLGDPNAALDCVLPAYRPALVCLVPAMFSEVLVLSLHMFLAFDPDNIIYFFANYALEESVTFFFLMPAVTKRALKRSILRAFFWGVYCGFIAWLTSCMSGFRYTDDISLASNVVPASRASYRAMLLLIEIPRLFFYCCVLKYLLRRRRDSILPYCVLQMLSVFVNVAYVLIVSFVVSGEWLPFGFVCFFILVKPWAIQAAFVLDSNYWRGLEKPARTRGITVFLRMLSRQPKPSSSRFDLNKHCEVGLWADEDQVDSILSRPLQKMLENNRKALVDFAFLEIEDVLLGHGAFAKVYRGKYKGNPVAVKIFLKQPEINAQSILTFAEEAKIALKLSHPNIVRFFGLCVRPPSVLLVFELCEQGNLFTVLRTRRQLEWRDRTTIKGWGLDMIVRRSLEATRALAYLHGPDVNFIHRDIKSLNYLVTREGTVKLTDFGTSRLMPSVNRGTQTMCDLAPLPFRLSIDDDNVDPSTIVTVVLPPLLSLRHASTATPATNASIPSSENKDGCDDKEYSVAETYASSLPSSSYRSSFEREADGRARGNNGAGMTPSNSMLLLSSSASDPSCLPKSSSFRSATNPIQEFFRDTRHSLASYMGKAERPESISVPLLAPGRPDLPRAPTNPADYLTKGVGTKSWMSPEVQKGVEYGKPSDVFSLCIVLWEITTSLEPYDDTSPARVEAIIRDLCQAIKSVSMYSTDVSVSVKWLELQALIEAGLSFRPADRPTAQEIVDKLERLLE